MGPGRDSGAACFDILLEARDFYRQNFPFVARARLKIAQRENRQKAKITAEVIHQYIITDNEKLSAEIISMKELSFPLTWSTRENASLIA